MDTPVKHPRRFGKAAAVVTVVLVSAGMLTILLALALRELPFITAYSGYIPALQHAAGLVFGVLVLLAAMSLCLVFIRSVLASPDHSGEWFRVGMTVAALCGLMALFVSVLPALASTFVSVLGHSAALLPVATPLAAAVAAPASHLIQKEELSQ